MRGTQFEIEDFWIEHVSYVEARPDHLARLSESCFRPAGLLAFVLGPTLACFSSARDSHSKRQELLIKFFKIMKLINEVVRCF
jgi:hypothetical protein